MLNIVESSRTIDEIGEAIREAAQKRKFGVLHVHNLKATMAKKGVEFAADCRIFEVCNPQQAKRVLESRMEVSTALPCRISVYEEDGKVKLATIKPSMMLEMFGAEDLGPVAEEVEKVMFEIMDEAAG
jgi:uncharacterized protein (DUF302 family)